MIDYFDANAANGTAATTDAAATVNGATAPATNGEEIGMDEISVSNAREIESLELANHCCSELSNTNGHSSPATEEDLDCQGGGLICAKEQASDTRWRFPSSFRFCITTMA